MFPPNLTLTRLSVAFCLGWALTFCPTFISKSDIYADRQPLKAANCSLAEGPVACSLSNCRKGKQNLSDGKCQLQQICRGEMQLEEEECRGGQQRGGRCSRGLCNGEGDLVGGRASVENSKSVKERGCDREKCAQWSRVDGSGGGRRGKVLNSTVLTKQD